MSSSFTIKDSLTGGIALAEVEIPKALENRVLEIAVEALDYAKANAPWEDRTGDARAGLDTDVSMDNEVIVWTLFHTVSYGEWLETIQSGRFAIIMPTLEIYSQKIGEDLHDKVVTVDYG